MSDLILEFVNTIFIEDDLPFILVIMMVGVGVIYFHKRKDIPNILNWFSFFVGVGVVALIIAYHWFDLNLIVALIILTIIGAGILGMIVRKIKVNCFFRSIEKLCDDRSLDMNYIAAWKILEDFSKSILTGRELKKYERYRIFLCIQMGNIKGARSLLDDIKTEIDKLAEEGNSPKNSKVKDELSAYYHNCMQLICIKSGDLKTAAEESRRAYDSLSKDTSFDIAIQVYVNRGVNSVLMENYIDADDWFQQALKFYDEHSKKKRDSILRANLFYNYCYNKTRLIKNDNLEWRRVLEEYKSGMDESNIQDLVSAYNIELQLLHQTNADTEQLARLVAESFRTIINNEYLQKHIRNRCIFEASQARIVWSNRLNPVKCISYIYKDLDEFEKLPMPDRYICFKDINLMMQEWRQKESLECEAIRARAASYMKNEAEKDLNHYRESIPNEAVLQRVYCLAELAGTHKLAHPDDYDFELVKQYLDNAIGLLRSNDLLIDVCERKLCLVDEMGGRPNFTTENGFKYRSEMSAIMDEVEACIPQLQGHPIIAEFALRIAFYSIQTNEFDRVLKYYQIFRKTKFDVHNLARGAGDIIWLYA